MIQKTASSRKFRLRGSVVGVMRCIYFASEITSGISYLVQQFFLRLLKGGDAVVTKPRKKFNP
jgi:hypothetical protein